MITHTQKMEKARKIFDHCLSVMDAKGKDYSGVTHAMSNFEEFGWRGIIVRLGDKWHRLKNLTKSSTGPAVLDEQIEDTLYDNINYSALALIMKELEDCR